MNWEMAVPAILTAIAVGGIIGHWIATYPGGVKEAESKAVASVREEMTNMSVWWDEELSKLREAVGKHAAEPMPPAAEIAAPLNPAPVQAAVAGWALGKSYTSPAALLADVARPDFPPVRIDGEQQAGVRGFDFWTLPDGSVTQVKPA